MSGYAGDNTIQGKIAATDQYDAIKGGKFWGDIPQEAVNAAKTAMAAIEKDEYYMEAYKTASSSTKERVNAVYTESFQANNSKSFFGPTWAGWETMKLRGIVENTAGFKYTGFYWR